MKARLFFASTVTLGILASFVFVIFFLIAYFADLINAWVLIGLTVIMNLIMWLVSPFITDWIQKVFYKIRWVTYEEFSAEHREIAFFMKEVCEKHRIKMPRIRIIQDANPTAYCYGSYPNNARLVLSEGIFKYLTPEEQNAVVGHELGHIVNKDFIIMTIAVALLEVLYELYYICLRTKRRSSSKKKDITPLIGILAYILYIIGSYLVLYLSRTREYLADRFSAEHTGNPDSLSMALVKIAYGIGVEEESESAQRLLASTRAMGIYDYKAAHSIGTTFKQAMGGDSGRVAGQLTKVFMFDFFSPWAFISELNSTHPLTGKRIKALSKYAMQKGFRSIFDFRAVEEEGKNLDRAKLRRGFVQGLTFYLVPIAALGIGIVNFVVNPLYLSYSLNLSLGVSIFGAGLLIKGFYMFGRRGGIPEKKTVLELMQDPYANPIRGRYVEVQGKVIGKADAGSYLGEDVKMHDSSGCLIYLNYESAIPVFGNLIFGLGQAKEMIDKQARAVGWFRRSAFQVIDLDNVETEGKRIKSYTRFWGIIFGLFLIVLGMFLFSYFGGYI